MWLALGLAAALGVAYGVVQYRAKPQAALALAFLMDVKNEAPSAAERAAGDALRVVRGERGESSPAFGVARDSTSFQAVGTTVEWGSRYNLWVEEPDGFRVTRVLTMTTNERTLLEAEPLHSVPMNPTTPDDTLLAAAQAGESAALSQLLQTHRHGVYRYGLQVCRTTEDAEDALQETLWAATRAIKSFRGSASSLASWMFTMIRRECFRLIDRHRRDPVALAVMEHEVPADAHDPAEVLVSQRRADLLVAALQALEPSHREVVLLRDIEELSAPEAAARLGISVDALKSRLHRARVNLRDHVLAHADES